MLTAVFSSLVFKFLIGAAAFASIVGAVSEVTGSSTHSVLNTLLNLLAAPAALAAAWAVKRLREDTESGETSAGRDLIMLRQDVSGLRDDIRTLTLALAGRPS